MQAARAARRKERILSQSGDRLAALGGEPANRTKAGSRLVLDDDEMDPALSPALSSPKNSAAVSEGPSTNDPTLPSENRENDSTTEVRADKLKPAAEPPEDLLAAAIDDVFQEEKASCG